VYKKIEFYIFNNRYIKFVQIITNFLTKMVFFPYNDESVRVTIDNLKCKFKGPINGSFDVVLGIEYDIHGGLLGTHNSYSLRFKPTASTASTWGRLPIGSMQYCLNDHTSYLYIRGPDNNFYSMGTDVDFDEIKMFFPDEIQKIDRTIPPTITPFVKQQIEAKIKYVQGIMSSCQ